MKTSSAPLMPEEEEKECDHLFFLSSSSVTPPPGRGSEVASAGAGRSGSGGQAGFVPESRSTLFLRHESRPGQRRVGASACAGFPFIPAKQQKLTPWSVWIKAGSL